MTRYHKLWRSVGGPGTPPHISSGNVKARVSAALDAGHTERKIYMKQRLCTALVIAAAVLAVTGTALAAAVNWDALSAHFKGDTAPGQQYLDNEVQTVSDANYTLTVESSVADENSVYLVVSITAVSEEAKEFLHSDGFISMDMLDAWVLDSSDNWVAGERGSDARPPMTCSCAIHELESDEENCRRFAMDVGTRGGIHTLGVRCGYMETGKRAEISVSPAPSVTVKIGASGTGILHLYPASSLTSDTLTVKEITLTPFTCRILVTRSDYGIYPRILLRMKDGSIRTQSQMMDRTERDGNAEKYRFHEVQDLDGISSVIVFDMEYPLDGSSPTPVEHDASLDPIMVKWMERLLEDGAYSLSAQELTEKLGGTFTFDASTGEAVCVYRGVTIVLQTGSSTALVNGEDVALNGAPALQDGVLAAPYEVFQDAWGLDFSGLREYVRNDDGIESVIWLDWYIVP